MDGFSVFDQVQHAGVDLVGQRQRAGEQRLALGGTLIEKLHMEDQVADFIRNANSSVSLEAPDLTILDRMVYAREQVFSTFKKVFPYILIGVGIGAVIHNWIPES